VDENSAAVPYQRLALRDNRTEVPLARLEKIPVSVVKPVAHHRVEAHNWPDLGARLRPWRPSPFGQAEGLRGVAHSGTTPAMRRASAQPRMGRFYALEELRTDACRIAPTEIGIAPTRFGIAPTIVRLLAPTKVRLGRTRPLAAASTVGEPLITDGAEIAQLPPRVTYAPPAVSNEHEAGKRECKNQNYR
jgi:hypothetical protein